ncbi:YiiD C-terminal domain-containing protein [Marinobacterium sediminicola]|uniref:Thioesterase domain-containing protein, putative n=1 Tax=Marinobacterium sediminicola TaxID=518898 RepID=A0ABY1S0M8_9GAMM|nr:YiiD C-terminal domain-containing protein [Marinobacterium sediminicola]ULG68355.1 thioesterase domain-containing protein [Marinobacterium sediminicola]SMR74766.1 thioesterase domain-containing protein, putative [Marinobacterium sediminicola]
MQTNTADFLSWLKTQIPLLEHLGIDRLDWNGTALEVPTPLAPNVNDKGTGFGGSQAAISTVAGWCLTTLCLKERGLECDVVIADSHLQYLKPVTADFVTRVSLADTADADALAARVSERGRAKLELVVEVVCNDQVCMRLQGVYVAIRR